MKWFGFGVGRAEARPALSGSVSRTGVPIVGAAGGEWPRNYEARVRAAYLENAVAQRAVRLVAESLGEAPVTASDPKLLALVTARSGGQPLLATVAAQLLLHGNAYLQMLCDAEGRLAEIYALRPERVSVVCDAGGWPAAYRYRVGARTTDLPAGPVKPAVVHIRSFDPLDDHYGLGCLGAASGAVAIHNAAARWSKALLDNAARPSGALVYEAGDGSTLSAEQFERLRREMDAFVGSGNAGRPLLLEGGLKWQAMSLSPADMDFAGCKAAAAREIALAFGVPSMLLGLPGDATYANYREANKALWRSTVLPLAGTILTSIAQGVEGWFEGAALSVDLNQVPALAEDRERLWASVSAASFLDAGEKRALLGLA